MTRRLSLILGLVTIVSISLVPTVAAHDQSRESTTHAAVALPTRIDLPDGFQPEGIASGFVGRLYVGSLADGAIWRGSAMTGKGRILVPGVTGRQAAGLHVDGRGRLWVAGANNHTVRVYSALTGRLLKTYTFPSAGFINDLAITREAVYATDSNNQQLAVIPLGHFGRLPDPSKATVLPLTGDYVVGSGFNANGIVARFGWLIIDQSNTGKLFRVDPGTGATKLIDTGGYTVANGDGLALRKGRLYAVRNQDNLVAVFNLGSDLLSASLVGEITSPGNLDVPTTAAFALDRLWVVNARFSTTPTATTPYWITRLPLQP
ncbi:MAG: superoxide dismutase [Chloroflexi bacterium]|nr:superoxide dismutase [Chloroflexota bacterium]